MSGRDSSGPIHGGGGSSGGTNCGDLAFRTFISSPRPSQVSQLNVGDVLDIDLLTQAGLNMVVVLNNGHPVGGIVHNQERIKDCLLKGFQFFARVDEISGGKVLIYVYSGKQ